MNGETAITQDNLTADAVKSEPIEDENEDHEIQPQNGRSSQEEFPNPEKLKEEEFQEDAKLTIPSLTTKSEQACRLTHTLKGHSKTISSICFSPDGTKLSTSSTDGAIFIWNVILQDSIEPTTRDLFPQVEFSTKLVDQESADEAEGINDLTWSPDSEYLISASDNHLIYIWSISQSTKAPLRKLIGHSHCVYCVKLNPIGTLLVSGSFDETIKVWDFLGGKLLRTLPGHSEVVSCLDFSRDGSVIVSGSFDGLIRMWDITSGQCLKTLVVAQETNAPVSFMAFTPNSRYLITCSLDSTVRIWDYRTKEGTVVKSYTGHSNVKYSIPARVISLKSDNKAESGTTPKTSANLVLMGSEDGNLLVWDLQSRELIFQVPAHQDSIIGVCTHPFDSSIVVTAGLDRDPVIKIFSLSPRIFHETCFVNVPLP